MSNIIKENKRKKAQEEMVGFAVIIIIVAVIILILLGISLNKPKTSVVESYEVDSFIGALLQHTTECSRDFGLSYLDVKDLISKCDSENFCTDEAGENKINSCDVLDSTVKSVLDNSWKAGPDRPVKGYELNITSQNIGVLSYRAGNITANYKEGEQGIIKKGVSYSVAFRAYY